MKDGRAEGGYVGIIIIIDFNKLRGWNHCLSKRLIGLSLLILWTMKR